MKPPLKSFDVTHPHLIAQTPGAMVWRVLRRDGTSAVLKQHRRPDMGNEAAGYRLLRAWNGQGAARLIAQRANAALLEDLPGPSLGDLARRGALEQADLALAQLARSLHQNPVAISPALPNLQDSFSALFDEERIQQVPLHARTALPRCRRVAVQLLATQANPQPLHGDLHHENARLAERGYCTFDPKGLHGEQAFELANAFRHPKGTRFLATERIAARARLWSDALDTTPETLLLWVVAKTGLSIVWRGENTPQNHSDLVLLDTILTRFIASKT